MARCRRREIIPDTPGNVRPIPMGYLDGLGDLQTQHSCVLLLDITENCNLECPTCFAASGAGRRPRTRRPEHPSDARRGDRARGRPDRRADAVAAASRRSTRRSSRSSEAARRAERHAGASSTRTASGSRATTRSSTRWSELRDRRRGLPPVRRLRAERRTCSTGARTCARSRTRRSARLTGARIFTTLAMAVAQGVNDDEVGAIVDYAFATDYIAGVAFQPMFGSGRANPIDPMRPGDDDRDAPARSGRRRWAGDRRRLHRAAVLAPRLLRDRRTSSGATTGRSLGRAVLGRERLKDRTSVLSATDRTRRRAVGGAHGHDVARPRRSAGRS